MGKPALKRKPLFSVVINVRNGAAFIEAAIVSVLVQTEQDFELIVVNNHSTDHTVEIVTRYADIDSRIVLYSTKHQMTLYQARNYALRSCRGEFIAFLDSDDFWNREMLAEAKSALLSSDAGLFYSNFYVLSERTGKMRLGHRFLPRFACGEVKFVALYPVAISAIVFKSELLLSMPGPFDGTYNIIGDFELIVRMARTCKLSSIDKPLLTYRQHSSNLSADSSLGREDEIEHWVANTNFQKEDKEYFLQAKSKLYLDLVYTNLKAGQVYRALKTLLSKDKVRLSTVVHIFNWRLKSILNSLGSQPK